MTETMNRPRRTKDGEIGDLSAKVREFAASDEFSGLRQDLKNSAIERSVYFAEASDRTVEQGLVVLYEGNKFGGFNHREKETFGPLEVIMKGYGDLKFKMEEEGVSLQAANETVNRERRVDVASRYARNDFAKVLNYQPGLEGQPGKFDYESTISNPDFILAETLVRKAVGKFS